MISLKYLQRQALVSIAALTAILLTTPQAQAQPTKVKSWSQVVEYTITEPKLVRGANGLATTQQVTRYVYILDAAEKRFVDKGLAGPFKRTGHTFIAANGIAPLKASYIFGDHENGIAPPDRDNDPAVVAIKTYVDKNAVSACRFYGSVSPGPNSHFYTVSKSECESLKALEAATPASQPRWNYEGEGFKALLKLSPGLSTTNGGGTCPTGSVPLLRAYNNGAARGIDSNHRFTTDRAAIAEVVATGWTEEDSGMCLGDSPKMTQKEIDWTVTLAYSPPLVQHTAVFVDVHKKTLPGYLEIITTAESGCRMPSFYALIGDADWDARVKNGCVKVWYTTMTQTGSVRNGELMFVFYARDDGAVCTVQVLANDGQSSTNQPTTNLYGCVASSGLLWRYTEDDGKFGKSPTDSANDCVRNQWKQPALSWYAVYITNQVDCNL